MAKDFFEQVKKRFPASVLKKADARYKELREEMLLREIRQAMKIPQSTLAKDTGIRQANLSRIERQSDMQIATLDKIISSLGGKMEIVAKFKGREIRVILPRAA